ncbi:MAG: hypothetical protein RL385_4874 [Pseudomonadota bacterium]|jgi:hypothetical protein
MEVHVVIATKGRAHALGHLADRIASQTALPASLTFVGSRPEDVAGIEAHPLRERCAVDVLIAGAAGLCIQRNFGVSHVTAPYRSGQKTAPFFIAFFDDDYRPAVDWLEQARRVFESQSTVVGLTGCMLADGINGDPITEAEAEQYLSRMRPPERHWATGAEPRPLTSMYGCNMAFRDRAILGCRFDENLPLYGWQEDRDFTAQAMAFGSTIYAPTCRGVHLGSRSGRISGLRFGYSQIANPVYMWRKGTISVAQGAQFVVRHLLSNTAKTLRSNPSHDYPGRLRGNFLAITDLLRGTCHPTRVLHIG